jgi:hypothetical protein
MSAFFDNILTGLETGIRYALLGILMIPAFIPLALAFAFFGILRLFGVY